MCELDKEKARVKLGILMYSKDYGKCHKCKYWMEDKCPYQVNNRVYLDANLPINTCWKPIEWKLITE